MKREDWRPARRAEREYAEVLWRAYEAATRIPAGILSVAEFLGMYARQAAVRMITNLRVGQMATWREAARASGRPDMLYAALERELAGPTGERVRELVRENAKLISSFPESVARRVAAGAAAHGQAGGRAGEFRGWLSGLVRSRATLVARTEIAKASAALTTARAEELDLPWYIWRTSKDERVRSSHRHMENVLIRFNDPPSPEALIGQRSTLGRYNAGEAPNDRCYMEVVTRPEQLTWPHKVYAFNRIQYMTLSQFRLINQAGRVAA